MLPLFSRPLLYEGASVSGLGPEECASNVRIAAVVVICLTIAQRPPRCYVCGDVGHMANACPKDTGTRVQKCYNCGGEGHVRSQCTEPNIWKCHNCGEQGHKSAECSKRVCHNCKEEGHTRAECPNPSKCHYCGEVGHMGRHCPKKLNSKA